MTTQNQWTIFSDGASRGNPGPAGCGAVIIKPDGSKIELKQNIGRATNNVAEYKALILALKELQNHDVPHLLVKADSELMIKQLRREYKVKNAGIIPLFQEIQGLLKNIGSAKFEHVRREFNKDADHLANMAIDEG